MWLCSFLLNAVHLTFDGLVQKKIDFFDVERSAPLFKGGAVYWQYIE